MKKIDLGQMVSIFANVGVIAGLIFLGYELHQNNEFLEQQERYTFLQNVIGFTDYSADSEIAPLLYRPEGAETLSEIDAWRRCQVGLGLFYRWQWEFDNLEIEPDGPIAQAWRVGWRAARFDDCWAIHRDSVGAELAEFIDTHVLE
jgi:hypothetical protein